MTRTFGPVETIITFVFAIVAAFYLALILSASPEVKYTCEYTTTNALDKTACVISNNL